MGSKPDPWDAAVNGIPEEQWDKASEALMQDFEKPVEPPKDPIWDKVGAITMGVCTSAVVITICLVILKLVGVIG